MTIPRSGAVLALVLGAALVSTACSAGGRHSRAAGPVAPTTTTATGAAPSGPASSARPVEAAVRPPTRPAATPCSTNTQRQYVYVSLRRQHMWMCERHRVARQTPITSGMSRRDTATPTGSFHIEGRNRNSVLTLDTGATYNVKYWIPFDAPQFGFHDSAWQKFPYGGPQYRTAGSHGCVHMPLPAIRFLYRWAHIGTPVRIAA